MSTQQKIAQQLGEYPIVLYMKGTPVFPRCGFSAKAVELLQNCLDALHVEASKVLYVDVLVDPDIREGIKEYGQWPTIPQLYLKGELVGGSDILDTLFQQGELKQMVEKAVQD